MESGLPLAVQHALQSGEKKAAGRNVLFVNVDVARKQVSCVVESQDEPVAFLPEGVEATVSSRARCKLLTLRANDVSQLLELEQVCFCFARAQERQTRERETHRQTDRHRDRRGSEGVCVCACVFGGRNRG